MRTPQIRNVKTLTVTACPWQDGFVRVVLAMLLAFALVPAGLAAQKRTQFDHLTTGFELTGQHRDLPCESCHANAVFKGTPHDCSSCHGVGTAIRAMAKPVNHILSSDRCGSCHTPIAWKPAVNFDHTQARGSCSTCHNGVQAPGKGPQHIDTNLECDACHSTIGWGGAVFRHDGITTGCASCHNGVQAAGMPQTHIPTNGAPCESCHSTTNFTTFAGTPMNHAVVAAMTCATCHEAGKSFAGVSIVTRPPAPHPTTGDCSSCHTSTTSFTGGSVMPSNHIPTSQPCALCHTNPSDFSIYVMSHQGISSGCATCHGAGLSFANMAPPTLKVFPANHIPTSRPCETCHSPSNFTTFAGTSMNHAGITNGCAACHGPGLAFVGTPTLVTEPAGHIPVGTVDCSSCHSATNFTTFAGTSMNHAGFTTNCIACHGAGLSFTGTPPVTTFPSGHIPTGTTPCEGCHSTSTFTTFSGTLMNHAVVTAIACSTCHETGKSFLGVSIVTRPPPPHVQVEECSDCHTTISFNGASIFPTNHIPLPGGSSSNCSQCHSNASNYAIYTMDHTVVAGTACATCHGATASFANMAPPTLKVLPGNHIPVGTAACESCHSPTNFTTFSGTAMNHAAVSGTACASCHGSGKVFVGSPPVVTEPTNHIPIGSTACQSCHSATNFTTFSGTAMNHTGFTSNCIACHGAGLTFTGSPPVVTFPSNHIPTGTIACESCHSTSTFSTFSGTAMNHAVVTSIACSTCHEAGKSFVGSPAIVTRPPSPHVATGECSNCHFSTTTFSGATTMPPNHIPLPAADGSNCSLCHTNPNDYSVYTMNHVNITSNCAQCHGAGLTFANIAPPELKQPPAGPPAHIPTGTIACEQCHTPTNFTTFAGTIMKHAAVRAQRCDSCHEYGMAWYGEPNLWVRDGPNHHKGQDCGGSGCHTPRDKFGIRRPATAAVRQAVKATTGVRVAARGRAGTTSGIAPAAGTPSLARQGSFDHRRVFGTSCISCHDQASGAGKPASHIATSNACETCHMTLAWLPVSRVDHTQVKGTCASCHDGTRAKGKPSAHVATTAGCESCHTTNAWTPARFDHAAVAPHTCTTCHDAVHAIGLPRNHVPTSQQCDTCHGTLAWLPAKLDHSTFTSGCANCHNNTIAVGKPPQHMSLQRDCASCHTYSDWSVISFKHASAVYPGEHRATLTCVACHTSNTDQIPYLAPADAGKCGSCHVNDFKPDAHPKTVTGERYTASELANCTGACHVYSDSTHSTVSTSLPGPYHRVSDAAFKH